MSAPDVVIRVVLVTDLVDSTGLVARLGDRRAAGISLRVDAVARELLRCAVEAGAGRGEPW